jgi:hypothetical protein
MKGLTKWIITAIFLIFCIQAVSAFGVSSISVDPSGSLTPGTPVIVTYRVDFTASAAETFPSTNELQMSTDLDKPKWTYTLVLDGVETPQPSDSGRILAVSGWILSYPAEVEESMKVTLEGTAPTVQTTSNKTIIQLQEVDSHNNVVSNSVIRREAVVVNVAEVQAKVAEKESVLQTFRSHIDEKSAMGIDTAEAEVKYSDAKQKISAAKTAPSTQYVQSFANLDAAQKAIDDGEAALERAWAESEVTNAQIPISNVDNVIAWFKGNASTRDDAQLPAIIAKREVAVSYISTANDEISSGNYAQARNKAAEAFNKGNESYTDALKRQYDIVHGGWLPNITLPKVPGGIFLIIGIVVVVLAVVGVIIYRKRSHWDELG